MGGSRCHGTVPAHACASHRTEHERPSLPGLRALTLSCDPPSITVEGPVTFVQTLVLSFLRRMSYSCLPSAPRTPFLCPLSLSSDGTS